MIYEIPAYQAYPVCINWRFRMLRKALRTSLRSLAHRCPGMPDFGRLHVVAYDAARQLSGGNVVSIHTTLHYRSVTAIPW